MLTEINIHHYEIERSTSGQQFVTAGQLAATGNNGDKVNYSWMDLNSVSGMIYYRIKAVDFDGKILYSTIIRISLNRNSNSLSIYPNPVVDKRVTYETGNMAPGNYKLSVIDMTGRAVYYLALNHQGGAISQSVLLPISITPGVYQLQIRGTSINEMKTFVVL